MITWKNVAEHCEKVYGAFVDFLRDVIGSEYNFVVI